MGLRANATATPVRMSSPGAASAAAAHDRYAVRPASVTTRPSKPAARVSAANRCTSGRRRAAVITSIFITGV
jgi:hypothetical protein